MGLRALFPGSFDPPTVGHREVLVQACQVFDEVLVGVALNPDKPAFLSLDDRLRLLACMTRALPRSRVVTYEGLTAHFARRERVDFLVRGLRDASDVVYEKELAYGNQSLGDGLRTVFFLTTGPNSWVSSRLVRELIKRGGPRHALPYLPPEAAEEFLSIVEKMS